MSLVKQAIIEELKDLIPKSVKYSELMKSSKTKTKYDMMKDRLKRNNEQIAELMTALDILEKRESAPTSESNIEDEGDQGDDPNNGKG